MRAGDLRDRITVQRPTTGDDGFGNVTTGWADLCTLWANIRETPGKEAVAAGRIEASRTATIWVRDSSVSRDITAADRVVYAGQVWNIRGVGRAIDRTMRELLVEAGVAV